MSQRKVSGGGLVATAITAALLSTPSSSPLTTAGIVGAASALLVRSCVPPLTFGRGVAAWAGGAFAANAVQGAWFLGTALMAGRPGLFIREAGILLIVGAPLGLLLLRYGFARARPDPSDAAQTALRTAAQEALRRACKLEADGEVQEAAAAYRAIITSFGGTSFARDAESCLKAMELASNETQAHPRE